MNSNSKRLFYIWQQFERLFQFSRKVDELTYTIAAEEVS